MAIGVEMLERAVSHWGGDGSARTGRYASNAAFTAAVIAGHCAFVWMPLKIFEAGVHVTVLQNPSPATGLHLPASVKLLWAVGLLAMFVLSAVLAGFQKHVLAKFGRFALLVWTGASSAFFIAAAHVLREASSKLDIRLEDNALVIGYLGCWLLVLGYLSKQPWDEARDKWARAMEQA